MSGGRPSKFSLALAIQICERLADGETLTKICKDEGMPTTRTIRGWQTNAKIKKKFLPLYTQARLDQQFTWADSIVDISEDESRDYTESVTEKLDSEGNVIQRRIEKKSDNTAVQRDKLRTENRKWLMARIAALVFGDKVTTEHTGKDGGPIAFSQVVDRPPLEKPEEWEKRVTSQIQDRAKTLIQ